MMIASVSQLTSQMKLGSLTTNLNFYKYAALAAWISTVDNMTKGRLIMGIGARSKSNRFGVFGHVRKEKLRNHVRVRGSNKKILISKDLVDLKQKILEFLQ